MVEKETEKLLLVNNRTEKFFRDFFQSKKLPAHKKHLENDAAISTAVFFEKFRAAVEYHDDHLIFKNTISRIVNRTVTLSPGIKAKDLLNIVSTELIWADLLQPKSLENDIWEQVELIMERYLTMIRNLPNDFLKKSESVKMLANFMACEIEESFHPKEEESVFVDFAGDTLAGYFQKDKIDIAQTDHILQIRLAIYSIMFKPDNSLLSYKTLTLIDSDWKKRSNHELKVIANKIDFFWSKINYQVQHPFRPRYIAAFKNIASPYLTLLNALLSGKYSKDKIEEKPEMFFEYCMTMYYSLKSESRKTVWRGVYRALLFIFLTKLILVFIVEMPVDRLLHGAVSWKVLAINLSTPPILMLLAGMTIPPLNPKNDLLIRKSLQEIIFSGKLEIKPFNLSWPVKRKTEPVFEFLLWGFSLALIVLIILFLSWLQFNFVSIILFFIFVSAVSFLALRIRANSRELGMSRPREDSVTSIVELIFVPFANLGKRMSQQLTQHNPMLFVLDFLIEAPLKTLLRILRSWFRFVSRKKEEMEY